MKDSLFIILQHLIPQHLLSRCIGKLAQCETPWIKNPLIKAFISKYNVNMAESLTEDIREFSSFNDFFCRELKPGLRSINTEKNSICSPADGTISQLGKITNGRIFQAKGQHFSVEELLADTDSYSEQFKNGRFVTIYLSPKDYHRVHMPVSGTLIQSTHVPGKLFSVNPTTCENVPRLFARNERLVCIFNTEHGPMALVLVGAMIVASIETIWAGQVSPAGKTVTKLSFDKSIHLKKGEEMGRFKLGSTAILLLPDQVMEWQNHFKEGSPLKVGESMGEFKS